MNAPAPAAAYATAPTPGAPHEAGGIAWVAAQLGTPLMPWQRQVARVVSERDGTRWRYRTVVITVPRQSGKTTLMRSVLFQRALMRRSNRAFYTAQTGKDARERWKDLVESATRSARFAPLVSVALSAGASALTVTPTGSTIAPFAPNANSLHGYTADLVMVDEAFAHDAAAGADLMGAIGPTQITIPDAQLWIVSTAGSAESVWLRQWVDAGRAATADPGSRLAYFEWSCPPSLDPFEPASWPVFHPALGHTIDGADLAAEAEKMAATPGEFRRAYGNLWTGSREPVVHAETWAALGTDDMPHPDEHQPIGLGLDITPDRRSAALWGAWIDSQGQARVRRVRTGAGIGWVADAARELLHTTATATLGIDCDGPGRQIAEQLMAEGVEVTKLSTRDMATAFGSWCYRVAQSTLSHDQSPALAAAIEVAALRAAEDGGFRVSRADSTGPVAALTAQLAALRMAELAPAQVTPMVVTL